MSRQLKGLDVDARNAALQRAFGDEGFSGVQILLDKLPGLRAGLLDLADTSGVLDDGMRQFLDTPAGRLQTMQANVAELRTALTKGAAPVERFAVGMAQGLAGAAKEYPRAAAGIGLVGSAVGAAVAAVVVGAAITRGVWWAWLELGRSVRMVRKAAILSRVAILLQAGALRIGAGATWAWTIAQRALNLAMRLNPIGLVITGVVLLAGVVWRYWGPISRFAGRMWDGMRAGFGRAWEWIRGFFAGGPLAVLRRLAGFHPLAIGVRLMAALADGVRSGVGRLAGALWDGLERVAGLLPSSDAREGPFSRLTASGASILRTVGAGVRSAGPGGLRAPLAAAISATAAIPAAAATATPAAPSLFRWPRGSLFQLPFPDSLRRNAGSAPPRRPASSASRPAVRSRRLNRAASGTIIPLARSAPDDRQTWGTDDGEASGRERPDRAMRGAAPVAGRLRRGAETRWAAWGRPP